MNRIPCSTGPLTRGLMALTSLALGFAAAPIAIAEGVTTGEKLFATRCASCHGVGGSPDANSPIVQALGVMPADFSDPLFNSREPAGDWEMVITHGGHAMGLAAQMPAQGEVLTPDEVSAVTAYIKSMVDTSEYPPG